jgi:hypothetical protein
MVEVVYVSATSEAGVFVDQEQFPFLSDLHGSWRGIRAECLALPSSRGCSATCTAKGGA